ncbi:replication initiation protein, partial [Streptomyces sp. DH41]|uniref:replication initiation protein n=1 Tax=Streptomyces sp. DH41 TaxID=3040125 RepID=UPI003014C426
MISEFKRNVLDPAIRDIENNTPYRITYSQIKTGRIVSSIIFDFDCVNDKKISKNKNNQIERDNSVLDMFTNNLSDAQLTRIARNKQFIADYNHLISPQSNAN